MDCPHCGSDHVEYIGVDDSGGDFRDPFIDLWRCWSCNHEFESSIYDLRNIQEDENFQAGREENPQ